MAILYEREAPDLGTAFVRDPDAQICDWQGKRALRLSGLGASLLVLPELSLAQGWVELEIWSEGVGYPGIAFRVLDSLNYELAYAQPHTSGKWDAIQYDPVFHGSNTWQLYHGPGAQKEAVVPVKDWFRLRVEFQGQKALIQVDEQPPLAVGRLAHAHRSGQMGLWTYRPAYFANLRIGDDVSEALSGMPAEPAGEPVRGMVDAWFLDGFGVVKTEPNGILNLNRYLPVSCTEVVLKRSVEMLADGEVKFSVGFSDALRLLIDEEEVFHGENLFLDAPEWEARGYVHAEQEVSRRLGKGTHQVKAFLKAKEPFGYGMLLAIDAQKCRLLPAEYNE